MFSCLRHRALCWTHRPLHKLHLPLLQSHPHLHHQAGILHQRNHLPPGECPQTEVAAHNRKKVTTVNRQELELHSQSKYFKLRKHPEAQKGNPEETKETNYYKTGKGKQVVWEGARTGTNDLVFIWWKLQELRDSFSIWVSSSPTKDLCLSRKPPVKSPLSQQGFTYLHLICLLNWRNIPCWNHLGTAKTLGLCHTGRINLINLRSTWACDIDLHSGQITTGLKQSLQISHGISRKLLQDTGNSLPFPTLSWLCAA